MKVTQEMVQAYHNTWHKTPPGGPGDRTRAGLEAVFRLIDPVPEDVDIIIDRDGDEWIRNVEDPMVWILRTNYDMFRTYRDVEERFGPITWEGRK